MQLAYSIFYAAFMTISFSNNAHHLAEAASSSSKRRPLAFAAADTERPQHLVLVGGGHAHVQVIKALNSAARPSSLQVTLIDAQKSASYSGMVPGAIADLYTPAQTQLHLEPLARWAGIRFVHDPVVDIDLDNKQIVLRDAADPIPFDAISIDIGSASRDLDVIPGARQHTIPTRPIEKLVRRLNEAQSDLDEASRLVVVGGGVAGIELAMSISTRWKEFFPNLPCTILDAGQELLPNESKSARQMLRKVLCDKNIHVEHGCVVESVEENEVMLQDGRRVPFSHCVWATGAGAHQLAHNLSTLRGLQTTPRGWIEVNSSLQSKSHPFVFAAGDCASIETPTHPKGVPKAGVYAVRAGPVLIENLTRFLRGDHLLTYEPQDDFLKLLVCGNREAMGFRFGLALHGKWVFALKDRIDQNFMKLFDVSNLEPPTPGSYDTSQYDASSDDGELLDEVEAAQLLQRSDEDVDASMAQRVLRRMANDGSYRKAVLQYIHEDAPELVSLAQ